MILAGLQRFSDDWLLWTINPIMDAIIFIDQEGVGNHAEKVKKILMDSFNKKINEGKKIEASYKWDVAENILDELLYTETNQLKFEE